MRCLFIGIGAAGGKSIMAAIGMGIIDVDDTILINSTSKDFPKDYTGKTIVMSSVDSGCGKERSVAHEYALKLIKEGMLNVSVEKYTTVIVVTSTEGGTGSGSSVVVSKFMKEVQNRNVHVVAFTGFEEDVRGLSNTIEFFKEIDSKLVVHAISNASFLQEANGNKYKAEQLANVELCKRIAIITGKNFIASSQNIDDTDILKVSNTSGYMTVEEAYLDKPLVDVDDFNKVIKQMIYNSHSIKSKNPGAIRIGIILNLRPESEDAVDYSFQLIKEAYGNPYECFQQKQWDGKREYIQFIVSGMQMPLDAIQEIFDRYNEAYKKVQTQNDQFYQAVAGMNLDPSAGRFDMIKPVEKGMSIEAFLKENK
jgi:cell division GTPase FtsZ